MTEETTMTPQESAKLAEAELEQDESAWSDDSEQIPEDAVKDEQCRFKVGDTVRVIKPEGVITTEFREEDEDPEEHTQYKYTDAAGHYSTWSPDMDDLVGTEHVLQARAVYNGWVIPTDGLPMQLAQMFGAYKVLIEDWLELVEEGPEGG